MRGRYILLLSALALVGLSLAQESYSGEACYTMLAPCSNSLYNPHRNVRTHNPVWVVQRVGIVI